VQVINNVLADLINHGMKYNGIQLFAMIKILDNSFVFIIRFLYKHLYLILQSHTFISV